MPSPNLTDAAAESRRLRRITASQLGAVVALAAGLLFVSSLPIQGLPVPPDEAPGLDAHVYLAMAEAPTTFTRAPYAYRLAVPLAVHWLPVAPEVSFLALALLGLLLAIVLGYAFLRALGFDHRMGLLGVVFIGTAPEISVYLRNHFLVDPMALALVVLLLLAIQVDLDDGPIAFLLLAASLFKETAFYVVPVLYLSRSGGQLIDARAAGRVLLVTLPALAVALAMRFLWAPEDALFPYLSPWAIRRVPWFGSMESYRYLWRGLFGYLSILAIANAFVPRGRDFAWRYAPYGLLVVAQLVVPMNNERLLFFGFPFIVPLALLEFQRLRQELPAWFPLLAVLLVFCYLFLPGQVAYPVAIVLLGRLLVALGRSPERTGRGA